MIVPVSPKALKGEMTTRRNLIQPMAVAAMKPSRFDWLDVMRLLAMLAIVGFHWLRTSQENGAFGLRYWAGFEDVRIGFSQVSYLVIDGSGLSLTSLANNTIGVLFGYGWEAVNVFVLLSGVGLALSYRPSATGFSLKSWYARRFSRILLPYYAIAFPLVLCAETLKWVGDGRSGLLGAMAMKLGDKNLSDPIGVELLKHLFLVDPRQAGWAPFFFSPAWWFIPPILVAYACFPLFWRGLDRFGATAILMATLAVSVVAYWFTDRGRLWEHGLYFVVLHEGFDFTLGIVIGRALGVEAARERLRAFVGSPLSLVVGAALFACGNVANWYSFSYPISSALFTPGYSLLLAWVAIWSTQNGSAAKVSRRVDSYHVYLLHQFLAFPLVLVTVALCHAVKLNLGVGFGLGFLAYLAVCVAVVTAFELIWRTTQAWLWRPGATTVIVER
jgi:peptidoglycan/LPS O-acetylase OafA/YrhL